MDIESAKSAANEGNLNKWVHDYLIFEKETQLDNYLQNKHFTILGPKLIDITKLERTIGPEQNLLNSETSEEMEIKIKNRLAKLNDGIEFPIIAEELDGHFVICDGNHLFEALKKLNRTKCWVIYWNDSNIHNEVRQKHS